eukprot:Nk52_evm4s284 gene=Nk52_evmTU4s284
MRCVLLIFLIVAVALAGFGNVLGLSLHGLEHLGKDSSSLAFQQVVVAKTQEAKSAVKVPVSLFEQKLDHFNKDDKRTFAQRYFIDTTYSSGREDAPVFFYLAGEAPMEFFEFQSVAVREWARKYEAVFVVLEHRYYGKSVPFEDFSTEHLKYLSSRQALEDAANFIVSKGLTRSKLVTFGCSYAGFLSANFRAKYPEMTIASVAASAPMETQFNFSGFFEHFAKVAPEECSKEIHKGSLLVLDLLQSKSGREQLQRVFKPCSKLGETLEENFYFMWDITGSLGSANQFQNPPAWPLNKVCGAILHSKGNLLERYFKAYNTSLDPATASVAPGKCQVNDEKQFIRNMRNISSTDRLWWFQKCTEVGFFKPVYPKRTVFFPYLAVEHIANYCTRVFGIPVEMVKANVDATNAFYGGFNFPGKDVIFTNGLNDPWHLRSFYEPRSSFEANNVQVSVDDAGHCAPFTASTEEDPKTLTASREKIANFLGEVLKQ